MAFNIGKIMGGAVAAYLLVVTLSIPLGFLPDVLILDSLNRSAERFDMLILGVLFVISALITYHYGLSMIEAGLAEFKIKLPLRRGIDRMIGAIMKLVGGRR